jgi:hypothetical protein
MQQWCSRCSELALRDAPCAVEHRLVAAFLDELPDTAGFGRLEFALDDDFAVAVEGILITPTQLGAVDGQRRNSGRVPGVAALA